MNDRFGAGRPAALACALAGLAAVHAERSPLEAQEIDAGRLAIEVEGRSAGTESYRIWRDAGTIRARARVAGDGGGPNELLLQLDGDFRPVLYKSAGGVGQEAEATVSGDRLTLHVRTEEGERWKEFLARGAIAILEPRVAHHYLVALRALGDPGAGARISVVIPTRTEQTMLVVTGQEADQVRVGDRAIAATRYDVELLGGTARVWVDGDGRLLRLENPSNRFTATRLPDAG